MASTHLPNFDEKVASAVALALRDRDTASATKTPAPPHGWKLVAFSDKPSKWVDFNRSVSSAMELPSFSPGGTALVTTGTNRVASRQLRVAILSALLGDAAARFDDRPQFIDKGFEMETILRDAHAPTGKLAFMNNFCSLTDLEMVHDEALKTYI